MLDLPPAQVVEWMREHVAGSWKQAEYDAIPDIVRNMIREEKSLGEIEEFLGKYGIERRQEETVKDAVEKLERDIKGVEQQAITKGLSNLSNEVDAIFEDANKVDERKRVVYGASSGCEGKSGL